MCIKIVALVVLFYWPMLFASVDFPISTVPKNIEAGLHSRFHFLSTNFSYLKSAATMQLLALVLGFLVASAVAAPTTGTTTTVTSKVPDYMTVAKCKSLFDSTKAKKTLFWSGCGNKAKAALTDTKNRSYLSGYDVMRGLFVNKWSKDYDAFKAEFKTQTDAIKETADHSFWDSCSQALASLAEGESYIMMPGGTDKSTGLDWGQRAKSHWAEHEYPIICKDTAITKLYRLSATDATVKEDLTTEMLAQRKAGTCPALSKVAGGGEDD